MQTWMKLFKDTAIFFGIIASLSGMAAHEISQSRELENSKTVLQEQGRRIDRYESKMDKLLDKIDAQNDKIDNLRIEVLKNRH